MRFAIEVGEVQKQKVEFDFNQLLGRTVIRLNGQVLKKAVRLFSEPVIDSHEVSLAEIERVDLRIEKRRKLLFSSHYTVFVNNRLTQVFEGV